MDTLKKLMNPGSVELRDPVAELSFWIETEARAQNIWVPREISRGAAMFTQGDPLECAFLLQSGLVKLVYATPSGDEWIKSLIVDSGLFGATNAEQSSPVTYSAIAIEPSIIVALPIDWFASQIAASPQCADRYDRFIEWVLLRKEKRERDLLCLSAEERYLDLIANEATLLARLPQADIAGFLRITPVAFSRIKRRLRDG